MKFKKMKKEYPLVFRFNIKFRNLVVFSDVFKDPVYIENKIASQKELNKEWYWTVYIRQRKDLLYLAEGRQNTKEAAENRAKKFLMNFCKKILKKANV